MTRDSDGSSRWTHLSIQSQVYVMDVDSHSACVIINHVKFYYFLTIILPVTTLKEITFCCKCVRTYECGTVGVFVSAFVQLVIEIAPAHNNAAPCPVIEQWRFCWAVKPNLNTALQSTWGGKERNKEEYNSEREVNSSKSYTVCLVETQETDLKRNYKNNLVLFLLWPSKPRPSMHMHMLCGRASNRFIYPPNVHLHKRSLSRLTWIPK